VDSLEKTGTGTLRVIGNASHTGGTSVTNGTLVIGGTHSSAISAPTGTVRGTGTTGPLSVGGAGTLRPGDGAPGILMTGAVIFYSGATLMVDINGPTAGIGYSWVAATGITIGANVTLDVQVHPSFSPAPGDQFTILTNHTSGTFDGLPENAGFMVGTIPFRITYVGGGGHAVVLTVDAPPNVTTLSDDATDEDQVYSVPFTIGDAYTTGVTGSAAVTVTVSDGHARATSTFNMIVTPAAAITYTLAEGAMGSFFDTALAIANPHAHVVPVTITFLKDDGTSVVRNRNLMATSRTTINVDEEEGLEAAAFSIEVTSTTGVPLGVERTMWWDATAYGASTEKASPGCAKARRRCSATTSCSRDRGRPSTRSRRVNCAIARSARR